MLGEIAEIILEALDFVKVVFYFEPDISSYESEDESILAFIKMQSSLSSMSM